MRATLAAILLGIVTTAGEAWAVELKLGEVAGPIALMSLAGDTLVMNNYQERPATVVLFLSSRSQATERLASEINALHQRHRLADVLFVGVVSNPAESADELRQFAQRRGVVFPIYRDPQGEIARKFAATVTPELFLLDRHGRLVYRGGVQDPTARSAYEAAVGKLTRGEQPVLASSPAQGTPIAEQGTRRELDDSYGTIAFAAELVFEKIPYAVAFHCSTICEAANGDLLCLWYGGSYESADDQVLFLARKRPGDARWSEPLVLVRGAPQPPGNGVIFRTAGDRLAIVWCRMEGTRPMRRGSGWDRCRLFWRTSDDHGQSWSEDRPVFEETVWCVPRNPPITLADGTLVLPVEGWKGEVEGSHFLTLAPGASNWRLAGFTAGGSQPAVVERRDGSLLALLRHSKNITRIESGDRGHSWSEAVATPLKNPDSGISMTRLANGHLVLVYNDSQAARTPLSIVRSLDEGKTWETPLHLESNPGEYSYPCIIQTADGKVHVSYTFRRYTIKHVELNEGWLEHLRRPN